MKAVLCRSFGGPETLVVEDVPQPRPEPGRCSCGVLLAALNFFDTLITADQVPVEAAAAVLAGRRVLPARRGASAPGATT